MIKKTTKKGGMPPADGVPQDENELEQTVPEMVLPAAFPTNVVYHMDCLEGMALLPDNCIDMILCDLPYGTTQCKWDVLIPFDKLWEQYERIIKKDSAIVLTSAQPFTSLLVASNLKLYKYSWVWEKSKATGYLNSKKRPMVAHEDILVFAKKQTKYNPQMVKGDPYYKGSAHRPTDVYGQQKEILVENKEGWRYPRTVQYFKTAEAEGKVLHPTQKPVALFEYLIKTYTKKGDIVLDNCMGSGTTAVACQNLNRQFIGYEKEEEYFKIIQQRIGSKE